MIDTIQLKIQINKNLRYKKGISKDNFGWIGVKGNKGFLKYARNPSTQEKDIYGYLPQLEIVKRGPETFLYIIFSAPKILFENNLDELSEKDFNPLLERIVFLLYEIGLEINIEEIRKAKVNWIDFSKNIFLEQNNVREAIEKLNKLDSSLRFDITEQQFKNKGSGFQIYSINHSIVFYDKWSDLEKNKNKSKKSFDDYKNIPNKQRSIFDEITTKTKEYPNILREEIRFRNSKLLKKILKDLGFDIDLTFENIFKENISQSIILYFFNKITEDSDKILFSKADNEDNLLRRIKQIKPKIKTEKALRYIGIFETIKKVGIRGLREITEKDFKENRKTWYRRKTEITEINNLLRDFDNEEWYQKIKEILSEKYKPFRRNMI